MGATVYVLMVLEGSGKVKEWRPYAVTSNPDLAEQYYSEYKAAGVGVDFVPLELDNLKNIEPDKMPSFTPRQPTPNDERANALVKRLEATIERMQKVIDDQAKLIKTGSAAVDPIPPKPKGFPEVLRNAQEIADYVETHATYEVDEEMVYELFHNAHAALRLVPLADLREGGPGGNERSKANEDKYLRQDLKTQPPALVEDGKVWDGNHRFRANKRRGLTHMWCYVVMDGEKNGDIDTEGNQ